MKLIAIALLALGLRAEIVESQRSTKYFPALNYGRNRWTSIRLESRSSADRSIEIEAYREDGSAMDIPPVVKLAPGEKKEFRLTGKGAFRWCWAKITTVPAVS